MSMCLQLHFKVKVTPLKGLNSYLPSRLSHSTHTGRTENDGKLPQRVPATAVLRSCKYNVGLKVKAYLVLYLPEESVTIYGCRYTQDVHRNKCQALTYC